MAKVKLKKAIDAAPAKSNFKNNTASDTLFVSNPKDNRIKGYQDSLKLYKEGNTNIPKNAFNFRKYKTFKSSVETNKIKGVSNYSGNVDPFAKDKIKPVRQYDFIEDEPESYYNGEYFPAMKNARKIRFLYKKPVQVVKYKKEEPKKEQPVKEIKKDSPKPIEKKQNVYEGSPVYSPGVGSGMPSALVGFMNKSGDTTYIKPEDYSRFAVPEYGKRFIESKSNK